VGRGKLRERDGDRRDMREVGGQECPRSVVNHWRTSSNGREARVGEPWSRQAEESGDCHRMTVGRKVSRQVPTSPPPVRGTIPTA
jgi:hypothetical protein